MSTDDAGARIASTAELGLWTTLRRGAAASPLLFRGIGLTLVLAVLSAVGKVVVPVSVQRTIDDGILADGGPDIDATLRFALLALGVLLASAACSTVMNVRLFRAAEAGLAQLRVAAFRHVHHLSVLTQNTERRGALVSRVTSDVDSVSQFVQWGGVMLLVSTLQIAVSTALMLLYSWQLTLVVWGCFIPFLLTVPKAQQYVSAAYGAVRRRIGAMLGAVSEAIVGAETIRAYGAGRRTQRRIDAAIEATRAAQISAQNRVSAVFSFGLFTSGVTTAAVVGVGTVLGVRGDVSPGVLVAFLFLVQLFTSPVQMATEVLSEMQNAVAGWRRVLAVLDTPMDVPDPGAHGVGLAAGPSAVELRKVSYAYPDGPPVLRDVSLTIPPRTSVAVVGATGSGKTTMAKLVVRLMDPTAGQVLIDGVDLRRVRSADLRRKVVLVPQEGFLFDRSMVENIAYALPERDQRLRRAAVVEAVSALGLTEWVADLPHGLDTAVGQRGESLSAGERQLVAIARAYLADADILVLDEATSAVDPATEVRIATALDSLTAGRSTITIAHRLSTAEAADLVVVVDAGRVVEVGSHRDLVVADGVYARLHGAWVSQSR